MIFAIFLHLPYSILGDFAASCVIIATHCLLQYNQSLYILVYLHFGIDS